MPLSLLLVLFASRSGVCLQAVDRLDAMLLGGLLKLGVRRCVASTVFREPDRSHSQISNSLDMGFDWTEGIAIAEGAVSMETYETHWTSPP